MKQLNLKRKVYENRGKKMTETKHECTGWSLVLTITRPDGTWFDKTITDMPDNVSITVNEWLTDYMKEEYE